MKKWCLAFFLQFLLIGSFYGQFLSASQHKYLEKQLVPISNDTLLKEARWKQLALHLKNKNLILIGENNHGSKEIFQWRNDLIRYLHQQEGFNAVLFESGFGELLPGQEIDLSLSPLQMIRGLFGGWRTPEFKDLMAYINSEKMDCAGIDVQRSGGGFRELLKAFCREHGVDTYSWNQIFNNPTGDHIFLVTEKDSRSLADMEDRILIITTTDYKTGRRHIKGLEKIMVNRADYRLSHQYDLI